MNGLQIPYSACFFAHFWLFLGTLTSKNKHFSIYLIIIQHFVQYTDSSICFFLYILYIGVEVVGLLEAGLWA